jgi:enoyl-CoA hydratase/carnithine racemase
MLTGKEMTALEAQRTGLATRIVSSDKIDQEVETVVAAIGENPPELMGYCKDAIYHASNITPSSIHMARLSGRHFGHDPVWREGIQAYHDNRDPDWPE